MKLHHFMKILVMITVLALSLAGQTRIEGTIANGEALSTAMVIPAGCNPAVLALPGALSASGGWTAANLTFQYSVAESGGTPIWGNLKDENKIEVTVLVDEASDVIRLPPADWLWIYKIRIRSGTAMAPVNQGAARTLAIVCAK